jgi:hypothetical protein
MKSILLSFAIFFSFHSYAQIDSLSLEVFVNSPTKGQDFDLARQIGVKVGKQFSSHKFSLGYGNFKSINRWAEFYIPQNERWTSNALTLHNYTDSTPADARRGEVITLTHAISVGWCRVAAAGKVDLYTNVRFTAFINKLDVQQTNSKAALYSDKQANAEVSQGTSLDDVYVGYIDADDPLITSFTSLVPAVNLSAGAVFRFGESVKLIPQISLGVFQQDNRIYRGNLYGRGNIINANVRPSLQLSYTIL